MRREIELMEEKQSLEGMFNDRKYAKMEDGREKLAARGELTRTAGSGSQTSEMEAERRSAEVENREEKMGHLKNQCMEDMAESRWNVKMEGGREKLAAKGEVSRTARSGSRNPEMEAKRLSTVTPVIREVNEKVLPMEEESKNIEQVAAGKDAPSTEMEGGFVMCDIGAGE